jgi:hypothetical protein
LLRERYSVPGFLFIGVASWVVAFGGVTLLLLLDWILAGATHFQLLRSLPGPLMVVLDICGAYAAIGGFCLYITMWIYWVAVERTPLLTRIGWFVVLLCGLPWGALIYALFVWRKDVRKIRGPQQFESDSLKRGME